MRSNNWVLPFQMVSARGIKTILWEYQAKSDSSSTYCPASNSNFVKPSVTPITMLIKDLYKPCFCSLVFMIRRSVYLNLTVFNCYSYVKNSCVADHFFLFAVIPSLATVTPAGLQLDVYLFLTSYRLFIGIRNGNCFTTNFFVVLSSVIKPMWMESSNTLIH
jgi:hypothetical protein